MRHLNDCLSGELNFCLEVGAAVTHPIADKFKEKNRKKTLL
jgi:hypothetical protein